MMPYTLTACITLASLLVYLWTAINAARARMTYDVQAPLMDGPLGFLSAQRVQANTVEQIVLYLPALWLCAIYLGDRWALAGGVLWVVGRIIYALGYYRDPKKRGTGFMLTISASMGLMAGTVVGLVLHGGLAALPS